MHPLLDVAGGNTYALSMAVEDIIRTEIRQRVTRILPDLLIEVCCNSRAKFYKLFYKIFLNLPSILQTTVNCMKPIEEAVTLNGST